jgi:hypothetical protein
MTEPEKHIPLDEDTKEAQIAHMEAIGSIQPGCRACQEFYNSPKPVNVFAPRHTASSRCRSGKNSHCTCDTCF